MQENSEDPVSHSFQITTAAKKLLRAIREPALVLNRELEIVAVNPAFSELLEKPETSLTGNSILDLQEVQWLDLSPEELEQKLLKNDILEGLSAEVNKGIPRENFSVRLSPLPLGEEQLMLITFWNTSEKKEHKEWLKQVLAQAPAAICVLRGPEHIFEMANENYLQLVGHRDIDKKSVREALPEVASQGFLEILDKVYNSGEVYIGSEIPVQLTGEGEELQTSLLDFVYQPIRNSQGQVEGIFVHAIDVTEKANNRKKLEQSEKNLQVLIDTVPVIIWITDQNGNSTYLNSNWYTYTGQSRDEEKGMGWLHSVHPTDREIVKQKFLAALEKRKSFSVIYRLRNKEGAYRWAIDSGRPKYDLEGEFEGMIGTVVDIHEDKIKEQLIREQEHRTKSIVAEATVATAIYIGRDMKIELANDAMISLWGKDRSVIGKSLREALPELEGQPFHDLLDNVFTTGETYWGKEDRVDLMIDGKMQTGYYNFTYKPLRDENGNIYGILNMALDVTDQVNARQQLEESETYFRQMADLMPEKVMTTNVEGKPIYFNQNWLNFTMLSVRELKQIGWTGRIHEDDRHRYERKWRESLETGCRLDMEIRIQSMDRDYRWHLSRAEAVKDENGQIKMWISTNTDIQRLKEEEKRKEDFLKMVSHELKTPVTSIKGYVQLLLSLLKTAQNPELENMPLEVSLERIDHQIRRLTRLISEMLDLSRIEEGKLELQKQQFSINELVNETIQDIVLTNTQHKIKLTHDFEGEVFGDKDRIGQVLINFVTNAIKYSPESQLIRVSVEKSAENEVAVRVKDEGIGIAEKDQRNIFKRFFRIGGENEETYSGFGIGLYLAKEIIQRHKGRIEVKSEKGEGSEFTFFLAIAQKQ
ncbi:MAG: PAS domain-containing protein [Salinimicrobium sp.]